jgi:uncharacterized protein YcbX
MESSLAFHTIPHVSYVVASLWRYPVKSMAGEPLTQARISADGVDGDRLVRVCGPEGVRTARRHHRLIGLHGTIGADGGAWIDGHPWTSAAALARVREAAGDDAWLEAAPVDERFDVLPLLIATDGAIAAFGRDVRRLRPNIVIGGVEGLQEFEWPGRELRIGSVRILIDSRRPRCPMTTVDPATTEVDPAVLKDIGRRFGGRLALNAGVVRGGTIKVGDGITIE